MTATVESTALDAAQRVVAALGAGVRAAFLIGSGAYGGFEPGASDVDVVVVWEGPALRSAP